MFVLVRDLMSPAVHTVQPTDLIGTARELMRVHGIHHLLVINGGNVVGVISPRDLLASSKKTVEEVMTKEFSTIEPNASLKRAAALMLRGTCGCLPVVENGALAGIITTSDLMRVVNADTTFA